MRAGPCGQGRARFIHLEAPLHRVGLSIEAALERGQKIDTLVSPMYSPQQNGSVAEYTAPHWPTSQLNRRENSSDTAPYVSTASGTKAISGGGTYPHSALRASKKLLTFTRFASS